MSTFSKKVAAAVITATTVVSLSGLGSFVGVAGAQAIDINALLAQIAALQAQLAALQAGGATGGAVACSITSDLQVGSRGAMVTCLQNALIAQGHLAAGLNTGYFGALTKAAVQKWQAANGVSATGYFGPISRGKWASMAGPVTPGTGTGTGTGVPNTTGNLVVGFAGAGNTSAISGAGQINVGRFSFSAPATTGVTITGLSFVKTGVLSDTAVNNLYFADATTGQVVAQFQSLTGGVATFANLAINVPAGQTWIGELRMDMTSASAGNSIGWQLTTVTTSGGSVTGLPVSAPSLTVTTVSNPAIATLALTETIPNASNVSADAGTQSVLISSWTANVSNSKVRLNNLQFTFVGSANPADVRNLQLRVNGSTVGTLAVAANELNFQVPGGITLNTGNSTIEIYADILGSPSRNFRLSLLQPYKVNATDTQYNTGITASVTSGSAVVNINTGTITVSLDASSPTQPVPLGASNVTILKTKIYAAGEALKVLYLDATLTVAGQTAAQLITSSTLTNVRIVDDAGNQLGNTISTVAEGTTSGTCTSAGQVLTCHFGTSGSPINYIVPANTSRTLSLQADLASTIAITSIQGGIPAKTGNLQGQTSFAAANTAAVTGSVLQISTNPLIATLNSGFTNPTYVAGQSNARVASFVLTAASSQSATVSSLTFDKDATTGIDMQKLRVMVGNTQFGAERGSISTTAAETALTFSGNPITVPAGGSVTIDLFADILTSATPATYAAVFDLTGWSALGGVSHSSITFPTTGTGYSGSQLLGQSVTISSGPTLTIAAGSDTPGARQIVMGSTGNTLLTMRFTAGSVEDVRINNLTIKDTISNGADNVGPFTNLTLWNGSTQVASGLPLNVTASTTATAAFSLNNPVTVPKNGSVTLTLKGDAINFDSANGADNISNTFSINSTSTVTAVGASSNSSVTVSGTSSGSAQTVLRSKVNIASQTIGTPARTNRPANDTVAKITFTVPSNAYQATLGTVTLRFAGAALATVATTTVNLVNDQNGQNLGTANTVCTVSSSACSVTFLPNFVMDPGVPLVAQVRISASNFTDVPNTTEGMSVTVNAASDVQISDGTSDLIGLETTPAQTFPFTVADVSYP